MARRPSSCWSVRVTVASVLVSLCGCSDAGQPKETTIGATFSRFPSPADSDPWLTVTVPAGQWPEGTTAMLDPGGVQGWQFEADSAAAGSASPSALTKGTRRLTVAAGQNASFRVIAPATLSLTARGFDPPLVVWADVRESASAGSLRKCLVVPDARQMAEITASPEAVSVPATKEAIVVDGRLDEWQEIPFITRPVHGSPSPAIRLAWSQRGIYGAVDAKDDDIRVDRENTHKADALELWIESDAARALDITRNPHAHKFVFLPAAAEGKDGQPGAYARVAMGRNVGLSSRLEAAWTKTDRGYIIEFLIPAECLRPAVLSTGKRLGFHYILFNDAAHGEDLIPFIPSFWRRPYQWGVLALK